MTTCEQLYNYMKIKYSCDNSFLILLQLIQIFVFRHSRIEYLLPIFPYIRRNIDIENLLLILIILQWIERKME